MPFVQSNGARIHWEAQGSGTPVLLIMGHLYSSRMWYPLLPALTRHHRAIWFDNRGTGDSDTTPGVTIEQFAADALAVLEAAGERSAHVYGVSMGGGIAAEFAMAYPERTRSVTLGCTMLKTEKTRMRGAQKLIYGLPRWLVRAMFKRAKPEAYGSAAPREAALHDIGVLSRDRFTMAGVRAQVLAIAAYATTTERARDRMTMPVLVLHGDEDKAVPVEKGRELHAIIPGSRYVEFKGAGHNYLVADNAGSTAAFLDFVAAADRARGGE
ncbi:alpha/beta hydrolase [Sphingomonas sp. CBMAI 2297]|uniref:alpha/beta fold hydrolase n=1 Tax=Sphingomonas sp. CBMAI 2297 TaxID=2991720 RepID=UPI002454CED8|nr:alpha/beta fold hydrolase [Sphingomonas sp. CBMAI 2297]MDH4745621.1 alpha/beta hydrolase [Sphingomonas sp. CBMAI 2297]